MNSGPNNEAILTSKSQSVLVGFLQADIEIAFTFLETAGIDASSDPDHAAQLIGEAGRALATVRLFMERVSDDAVRAAIESRANELAAAIEECRAKDKG